MLHLIGHKTCDLNEFPDQLSDELELDNIYKINFFCCFFAVDALFCKLHENLHQNQENTAKYCILLKCQMKMIHIVFCPIFKIFHKTQFLK